MRHIALLPCASPPCTAPLPRLAVAAALQWRRRALFPPATRAVFATIESAMQIQSHASMFATAAPTFVTVPFTVTTSAIVDATTERTARPISLLFTGRPHSSFDGSRSAVYRQLKRAGAHCIDGIDGRVTCLLCSPSAGAACASRALSGLTLERHEDPSVFGALKVLALASRATMCIEPSSDTLVRSHMYAAALVGCVPVIFDPATPMPHPFRSSAQPYPTDWAWRHLPPHTSQLVAGARAARAANYSAFAVVEKAARLVSRQRETLIDELADLAGSPSQRPRLRTLQGALARAAQLFRHAPRASMCAEPPCDAFEMFELVVRALRLDPSP
jgi:hypothetical protein